MELENFQGIITKYNVDSNGSSISVTRTEEQQIHPLKFNITTGIIDELEGFTVLNKQMYPVRNYEDIQNANQYWVDYAGGRVYFHKSLAGSAVRYRYGDKGYNLISVDRVFTKLDANGNVVELLSDYIKNMESTVNNSIANFENKITESTNNLENKITQSTNRLEGEINVLENEVDGFIADIREYVAILGTFEEATVVIKKLEQDVKTANEVDAKLKQTIADAQDDIGLIESTGNETITIEGSKFKYNSTSGMYECTVIHNCYSEDIHVTCKSMTTKDALFLPWKTIDKSNILLKSDVAESVIVTISARYYKATELVQSSIVEEVKNARQGKTDLLTNMNRKINYEDFTGNSIN